MILEAANALNAKKTNGVADSGTEMKWLEQVATS